MLSILMVVGGVCVVLSDSDGVTDADDDVSWMRIEGGVLLLTLSLLVVLLVMSMSVSPSGPDGTRTSLVEALVSSITPKVRAMTYEVTS